MVENRRGRVVGIVVETSATVTARDSAGNNGLSGACNDGLTTTRAHRAFQETALHRVD